MLISQDSRRIECPPTDPHYHVWTDRGLVMIAQRPRFNTRQAARKAALRAGWQAGTFNVQKCVPLCRFTVPRKRKRKPVKVCRHCGKVP